MKLLLYLSRQLRVIVEDKEQDTQTTDGQAPTSQNEAFFRGDFSMSLNPSLHV